MFVLLDGKGIPIVALSKRAEAEQWAAKFGWTVFIVQNGDSGTPVKLITGHMSLLDPGKPPIFGESVISFTPESQVFFPDATAVKENDEFYGSNLRNTFFCVPESVDVNAKALEFWKELHKRGLDLKRTSNDRFTIVKASETGGYDLESPIHNPVPVPTELKVNQRASVAIVRNPTVPGGSGKEPETI